MSDLNRLAGLAVDGDRRALEDLCRDAQQLVYRLALRFYSDPADAEDATQDIMVKVITNLGSFEGRAKFTTWVYTIASRHLVRSKRRPIEETVQGPEEFGAWLDHNLATADYDAASEAEYQLLCGEVRMACTYGMLLCLSREARMAYLLGDLIGFTDVDGAAVMGINAAAFRQRLARARRTMRSVIAERCGLVDAANPCRCSRQIQSSLDAGILNPNRLQYASHPGVEGAIPTGTIERAASQLDMAEAIAELYRTAPAVQAPDQVWAGLRKACPDLLS